MEQELNFTPRAQEVIGEAASIARDSGSQIIDPKHLFMAFLSADYYCVKRVFEVLRSNRGEIISEVESFFTNEGLELSDQLSSGEAFNDVLTYAIEYAESLNHDFIGVEHILFSIFSMPDIELQEIFEHIGFMSETLGQIIHDMLTDECVDKNIGNDFDGAGLAPGEEIASEGEASVQPQNLKYLNAFARNLNVAAITGELSPVVGRESEINEICEVLCRKTKNNPILLGDSGTGKTSIIEGLTQKIVKNECPDLLIGSHIFAIDFNKLLSGTKFRGDFESRLEGVIKEAKSSPQVILFMDEVHNISSVGGSDGSINLQNILKPYLSKGEIKCIGSTTYEEYEYHLKSDAGIARRFQPIAVNEPRGEELETILECIAKEYSFYHGVTFKKNLIPIVVDLCERFIPNRSFPDKAIDVIDQACSKCKIRSYTRPEEAKAIERELLSVLDPKSNLKNMEKQEDNLEQYAEILGKWARENEKKVFYVLKSDIHESISKKTTIPVEQVSSSRSKKIKNLKKNLEKDIIGQGEAIDLIHKCLMRSNAGISDSDRPLGTFLFLGQTGLGKTFLCKRIAKHLFDDEKAVIRFDMSEYSDGISVSKFIGSAPGYVGYNEGGQLTELVKRNPYSIILFDEIEKAHPEVIQVLLQILDDGRLTDNKGELVDFTNTIIAMTGNIGAVQAEKSHMGFGGDALIDYNDKIMGELKKTFKPELINRIDEIVVFNQFTKDQFRDVLRLEFDKIRSKAQERSIDIKYDSSFEDFIIKESHEEKYGARLIKRLLQKNVENTLAEKILQGKTSGKTFKFSFKNSEVKCISK